MFYDWIKAYQDYPYDLPKVGEVICRRSCIETEELLSTTVPAFYAEGSYCTTFRIHGVVCGRGRNPTLRLWPTIFSGKIDVFPGDRRSRLISSMTSVAPA